VIYACLAETIVLALEGRFEVFTIGRDTEWEKVKEIYKLGIKHGMKLAAISGVKGAFSDEDIARVVALAKKARLSWKGSGGTASAAPGAKKAAARKAVAKPAAAKKTVPAKSVAPKVVGKKAAPTKAAVKKSPAKGAAAPKKATSSPAPTKNSAPKPAAKRKTSS
jgi:hypothetical protein